MFGVPMFDQTLIARLATQCCAHQKRCWMKYWPQINCSGTECAPYVTYQPGFIFLSAVFLSAFVTAAMLVYQNKGMDVILVYKANPLGIELYFYANTFFCFIEPIWPLVT